MQLDHMTKKFIHDFLAYRFISCRDGVEALGGVGAGCESSMTAAGSEAEGWAQPPTTRFFARAVPLRSVQLNPGVCTRQRAALSTSESSPIK
jgi:hypothetical protein